jgi:hypothetical protein
VLSDYKPHRITSPWSAILLGYLAAASLYAGLYSPGPNIDETTAINGTTAIDAFEDAEMTIRNPELVAWANAFLNYFPDPNVSQTFKTPEGALGPADATRFHNSNTTTIVTLGDGGSITLSFATPILDTDGFDLVVFENGIISATDGRGFFELAFVEVSSNGTDFHSFSGRSSTPQPTSPYAFLELDPTNLDGMAGKYPATYGTPFDFAWLGLTSVSHVRIVDILGNGVTLDADGKPIFDPYPTSGSVGFDLDAVAAHVTARYSSWRKARFAWENNFTTTSDPSTDADEDGCSNLMEYAFATLPEDPTSRRQPFLTMVAGAPCLHLWRDPQKTDITTIVQSSSDLKIWSDLAISTTGQPFQFSTGIPRENNIIQEDSALQPRAVSLTIPSFGPTFFFRVVFSLPISP